jgi:hypothetical protein
MATVKLTMALPEEQLEELHRLVAGGQTSGVSGFMQH